MQGGRAERAARAGRRGARGERSGWEGSEREGGEGGEGGQSRVSMGVSGGTRANGTASCFLREKGSRERHLRRGRSTERAMERARAVADTAACGRETHVGRSRRTCRLRACAVGRARDVCVWRAFGCVFSVKKLNQHRKYRAGIVCRRRSLVAARRVQSQAISLFFFGNHVFRDKSATFDNERASSTVDAFPPEGYVTVSFLSSLQAFPLRKKVQTPRVAILRPSFRASSGVPAN